jgi:hypothetical protein
VCKRSREFRSSGVQEFRSSGVQEFRSSGVQEFRSSGVQAVEKDGIASKKRYRELSLTSASAVDLRLLNSRTPATPELLPLLLFPPSSVVVRAS